MVWPAALTHKCKIHHLPAAAGERPWRPGLAGQGAVRSGREAKQGGRFGNLATTSRLVRRRVGILINLIGTKTTALQDELTDTVVVR